MDEFFRPQQSPGGDSQVNATLGLVSPSRNPLLPRRFTTDSGRVPTLSTINTIQQQQPQQQRVPEPQDFASTAAMHKVQLLEKKRQDYERLREQRRRFEAEMHKLDAQTRLEAQELQQMQEDLANRLGAGHQSEPTTPPEYREMSISTIWSSNRPNRYSTSSLTSPPGLYNRPNRSGSLLTSPQSGGGAIPARFAFDDPLSHSMPGSRRNSDEDDEKEEAVRQDPTSHRSTNALNRYSMPVTKSRTYLGDIGLEDSNNTTGFLFGDEDSNFEDSRTTPTAEAYNSIYRSQAYSQLTSSALDSEATSSSAWSNLTKHQQRQSMSTIGSNALNGAGSVNSPPSEPGTIGSRPASIRHSMDGMKFLSENVTTPSDTPASVVSPPPSHAVVSPPKLQQSYSANDVPTMKTNGSSLGANTNVHAQQHFHNHNASIGRFPAGAMARHNQNMSGDVRVANGHDAGYPSISSTLHANAAPFQTPTPAQSSAMGTPAMAAMSQYSYYTPPTVPYNGAQPMNPYANNLGMLMQNLNINNAPPQPQALQQQGIYTPAQGYTGYSPQFNPPAATPRQPLHDSQARVMASRRVQDSEAMSRFQNMTLENAQGNIFSLAKDQHGCRFLQKQLENRIPAEINLIFNEVLPHVHELMIDPFGNYLCQKLLEYCNDDERTALIKNSTGDMVTIALNQHGTRALQKMIEHVSNEVQVQAIIGALHLQVVTLIQDLNGNHVIQKCLNKLSSKDSAFIFKAVGEHCVDVGTHRHGCCVLQRCIDHADGHQKAWLIRCITDNAYRLVQDPFGNYVIQYIIDLNEPTFTEPLVAQFRGHILTLSKLKFSSNVMEKCLRCASDESRNMIVSELLDAGNEIERCLRDSYGNYVYQTALDHSTNDMKQRLIDLIRPHLPSIRNTPYGRRISAKIASFDASGISANTPARPPVPSDSTGAQVSIRPAHQRGMSNSTNSTTSALSHGYTQSINGANGNGNHVAAITYPSPGQAPPQPPRGQQPPPQFPPGGQAHGNFF
ncbi:armadillo-type protein [Triangularia verruculosa]|uniref:Armadillo-type protein n=1 Tax=Triangularia verruculosa TaxID=2587418 RepID=A0AAN7AQF0_9PEZI|nr:armadillo-type protein [Triangularia verruculosa]